MTPISCHHYVFDVVPLLDKCMDLLQLTIDQDLRGRYEALYLLKEVLVSTERKLQVYLEALLPASCFRKYPPPKSITETLSILHSSLLEQQQQLRPQEPRTARSYWNPQEQQQQQHYHNSFYSSRSSRTTTDTLLFRLIVALQLCLLRLEDAHWVVTGKRRGHATTKGEWAPAGTLVASVGAGVTVWACRQRRGSQTASSSSSDWVREAAWKAAGTFVVLRWTHAQMRKLWMTTKVVRTIHELEDWIDQWGIVQQTSTVTTPTGGLAESPASQRELPTLDDKSRRLIEYALQYNPKSYFWQSQGEIRFLMLKRFMDVYYASVGTAIEANAQSAWQLPLVAGAAASFYSLTGTRASQKASQTVSTASDSLIRHAWGMVSLPAVKNLMLNASRIVKGASVADRIHIQGVSCFILSKDPAPELAAALKRQTRQPSTNRPSILSRMSTISESSVDEAHMSGDFVAVGATRSRSGSITSQQFAGSCGRYRQRDVIFHLTGGGFFAHTIASDLPFLLDWSASTGAVVICPEYALLPEHVFPVALEQISSVYAALVNGTAVKELGFEVNRIIVTGESAGGNLAASLCVRLGMESLAANDLDGPTTSGSGELVEAAASDDGMASEETSPPAATSQPTEDVPPRLPDALMLSCAALNLSLEVTYSRVVGTQDPVLPSGLISAISDAYLPNMNKQHPLASPSFAPDAALAVFPPTLLFAGSHDPLLDDSVAFNERLRCLGVESELRATHHMPHAYWGLGTAGFPEAQEVQQQCREWLARRLE